MNGISASCGQENCCKMDFFSVAKVRKCEVGKGSYPGLSEFHKIQRRCGKKRLALSEGNPKSFIIRKQNG